MKMKKKEKEQETNTIRLRNTLRWRLTLFVFLILSISVLFTMTVGILMLTIFRKTPPVLAIMVNPLFLVAVLLCICVGIGTLLSGFLSRYYLHPLNCLIGATKEVKKGNFKVQVELINDPHSEMGALTTNFNEMVRELDGIELFRNDFINNFSHEFKTPIVSIRGFANELLHGNLSAEQQQEYSKIIMEESDRLARLSTNVLELSKLENQQIVTNKHEFYLDEQLRQCILLQEAEWVRKNIEIIPELDEVPFYANEELLAHIWNNLITNAIKFTPEDGSIRITLRADEKQATVQISDTGIGMSEEVKAHIFEKFYQGDSSHHRTGYGIGLTMASRAAVLCGGNILVESTPGNGSTFTVVLPKARPEDLPNQT